MSSRLSKLLTDREKARMSKSSDEAVSMHSLLVLGIMLLICVLLTYIIPAGTYQRYTDTGTGIELVDTESFQFIERAPPGLIDVFKSLTLGLQKGSDIVFYLLIVGGMFGVINATGALNIGIANLLRLLKNKEWLLIPVMMTAFGCGSAFCANYEEYLVFVPLMLACCITAGFDSLTAVAVIFLSATAGYAGGMTNAFTVGKAQEIAALPLYSGFGYRLQIFIILLGTAVVYVTVRAIRMKKRPKLSIVYAFDRKYNADKHLNLSRIPKMTARHTITLVIFLAGLIYAVSMVIIKGYYVDELAAIFIMTSIAAGISGGLSPNKICRSFVNGCKDMLLPCLIIGFVNSSILILQDANIMDTILYAFAAAVSHVPKSVAPAVMFALHDVFNIFVPSGSAQASVTMPLMIPIADSIGMTRQAAVVAYQLGDALTNALSPTSGEVLAAIAICRVPFSKWVRYLLPLFIIWFVTSAVFATAAAFTRLGPF